MRSIRIAALLTFALAPALFAQSASPAAGAAATITPADVKAHIGYLASDELRGRDTPSPGLEAAAKYVADKFASFGLKAGGDSGSYIQRWEYKSRKLDVSKLNVELHGKESHQTLAYAKDYFIVPGAQSDSLVGDIEFAGTAAAGMQGNPAFAGKIVALYVPGGELNAAWQNLLQAAAVAVISSGARGMVIVLDPEFDASDVANVASNLGGAITPITVLAVRNDIARNWLKGTDVDLGAAAMAPKPVAGAKVSIRTGMTASTANPPNVIGILEGSDPELKNTYVVFSAHMDHVGVGSPDATGDSIYNGADDDASGTTAVLEVAQAFASMKQRPKRSIIFLGVSGEEKGLFGSKFFVEHPPVPAEKIVADINIDMVGRNSPDTTVAIGQEYSTLGEITQNVVKAHPELKLTVAPDLWPQERLFFRSDHYNFAMKKIPAIFFTSGLHADYHKPSDEPETIDNDKLARTARLVFWLGHEIANSATAPTWTEAGRKATNQTAPNSD